MFKLSRWFRRGDRRIYLEYSFLALLVMLPLLKPGFIFTLDFIFSPKIRLPLEITNSYVLTLVLHFLSLILTSQGVEKLLFFVILISAGVGAYRLVDIEQEWPKYFAGLLYMFNPFVYSHFMFGQLLVLLAYALLPFLVKALMYWLDKPSYRSAVKPLILLVIISIISLNGVYFGFLLAAVLLCLKIFQKRADKAYLIRLIKSSLFIGVSFIVLSSYWLFPMTAGKTATAQLVSGFDSKDLAAFQTVADSRFGLILNVAALYGFWGDNQHRYLLPKNIVPGWYIFAAILITLSLIGAVVVIKKKNWLGLGLIIAGLFGLVLGLGPAAGLTAGIYEWSLEHLPFFNGFREPQKFIALLALAYCYLAAYGTVTICQWIAKLKSLPRFILDILPSVFLILPIIYTPTMLWGFANQLRAADYPADWYALNQKLHQDKTNFKILFLPWHQYMSFNFAGRIIATPAQIFFDKPVVQGDNIEIGAIYTQVKNPISTEIEKILGASRQLDGMGERLKKLDIKYVILAKDADWTSYDFLSRQTDLQLTQDSQSLRVYSNIKMQDH